MNKYLEQISPDSKSCKVNSYSYFYEENLSTNPTYQPLSFYKEKEFELLLSAPRDFAALYRCC